ncbi:MAG: type II toxin-antitoxin system RelE family toxin [Pyrinomonadaceae bacterium]
MKVEFRKSFTKDLKNVSDGSVLKRAKEVVEAIETANALMEIPNIKKLKGEKKYFRLKIGDFRLGFAFANDTIIFVRFLHRKDIYKYFP